MNKQFHIKLRPAVNAIYIDKVWMLFTSGGFYKRPATASEAVKLEARYTGEQDLFGRRLVTLNLLQQAI